MITTLFLFNILPFFGIMFGIYFTSQLFIEAMKTYDNKHILITIVSSVSMVLNGILTVYFIYMLFCAGQI